MGPLSFNGGHPANVIVTNITPNGFDWQIAEWPSGDGPHMTETGSWVVADKGTRKLAGGTTFEAGHVSAVGNDFKGVSYRKAFGAEPVVIP